MLHTSDTVNWNAWEKNIEPTFNNTHFSVPDGEKLR